MRSKIKILTAAFFFVFFINSAKGITEADSLAYPFTLLDLQGNKISFNKPLLAKLTVLVFWSSWEIDSINLLVKLQKYYDLYKDKGLSIVSVCSEQQKIRDGQKDTIIELIKNKKISFTILLDEDLKVFSLYRIIALPTTFLISPDFKIKLKVMGMPLMETQNLFSIIENEFEEKKEKAKPVVKLYQPQKGAARFLNLALLEFSRDRYDAAKNHALKAAELDSQYVDPLILLARINIDENNFSEAEDFLTKIEKLNPKSETVELQRLFLKIKLQKTDEAILQLRNFKAKHPANAVALAYLAYAYGVKKEFDESLKLFAVAENISQNDYIIPALKSEVLKLQGKEEESRQELLKSIDLKRKGVKLD
ncbi:MAG: redoxin domain-containing protein [Ignavibacteriaceae bacterium]